MLNVRFEDEPAPPPPRRRWRGVRTVATLLVAAAISVLGPRLAWGDRWLATELALLAPLGLVVGAGLVAAPLAWGSWRVRGVAVLVVLALGLPCLWIEQPRLLAPTRVLASDEAEAAPLRVVAWNVMSYNWGGERGAGIVEALRTDDADIVCLSEGTYRRQPPDFLQRGMGKQWQWASTRQLFVGSRHPILASRELSTRTRLRVFEATIDAPGGELRVLLADLPTPPRLDTAEMFTELRAILEMTQRPFVLVGDFNTPRGSWHLARTTSSLVDIHAEAGAHRWMASWPSPLPLWQIDHAFASPEFQPLRSELRGAMLSDHSRQHLLLRRRPESQSP